MNQMKHKTAAKLLSLDKFCADYIEYEKQLKDLPENQQDSMHFAMDFVPSVFNWWIDKKKEASIKQLNKIEQLYTEFELDDYEEFMEDERIKDI